MKIDTSLIEGFDSMTPDEKVKALQDFEYSDGADEIAKLKADNAKQKTQIDSYSSQIADYKRKEKDGLSEAERKVQELEESNSTMRAELEKLQKESAIATYKAEYIAAGYEEKLAESTAKALAEKDYDTVLKNSKKFSEDFEKKIKADSIKGMGAPGSKGGGSKAMTKDEIMNVKDAQERQKLIGENIELFTGKD